MEGFTVPCMFGGKAGSNFDFFVGQPNPHYKPLHFQLVWLKHRKGVLDKAVIASVNRLQKIAMNQDPPCRFDELMVYALRSAAEENEITDIDFDDEKIIDFAKRHKQENPSPESSAPEKPANYLKWYWEGDNDLDRKNTITSHISTGMLQATGCTMPACKYVLNFLLNRENEDLVYTLSELNKVTETQNFAFCIAVYADVDGGSMSRAALKNLEVFFALPSGEQLLTLIALWDALEQWSLLPEKSIPHVPYDLGELHRSLHTFFAPLRLKNARSATLKEQYKHAFKLLDDGHLLSGVALCYAAARRGHSQAMTSMGYYMDQYGDEKASFEWTSKAAKLGNAQALHNLGYDATKSGKDNAKALKYFLQAYKKGKKFSANNIGLIYLKDKKGLRDYKKARHWFKIAIDETHCEYAYFNMAEIYEKGLGVAKCTATAIGYYTIASDLGNKAGHEHAERLRKKFSDKRRKITPA